MSDKTDPRRCVECGRMKGSDPEPQVHRYETDTRADVLDRALYMAETAQAVDEAEVLAAIDAADRAAGIVRVDTRDEALVERLEPVVYYERYGHNAPHGGVMEEVRRDACRSIARAVLAALREEGGTS